MATPYFIPFIGIKQLPNPPFTKASCTDSKCIGYDSDGRGIDQTVFLKPGNSQLLLYSGADKGTYFKDINSFKNACAYVGAKVVGDKCELTQAQAAAVVNKHGAPATFVGDMLDYDESFSMQMLKSLLVVGVLIFAIRMINRVK
jgi:hypothetical protein